MLLRFIPLVSDVIDRDHTVQRVVQHLDIDQVHEESDRLTEVVIFLTRLLSKEQETNVKVAQACWRRQAGPRGILDSDNEAPGQYGEPHVNTAQVSRENGTNLGSLATGDTTELAWTVR